MSDMEPSRVLKLRSSKMRFTIGDANLVGRLSTILNNVSCAGVNVFASSYSLWLVRSSVSALTERNSSAMSSSNPRNSFP